MIKKVIISIIAVALFIVAVGIFLQKTSTFNPASPVPTQSKATVLIGDVSVSADVVKTQTDREKGLSGVKSLDINSGMLFIFDMPNSVSSFWMKGMLIPLDIIWIQGGKIIRIDKNAAVPDPNTPDNKLKIYSAGKPFDYVLEVNSGFTSSNSIKIGDSVTISGI